MKLRHLWAGLLLASIITSPARTWTSSDGSKTFEGDLKSYDAESGKVSVLVKGRPIEFTKDKLSADDITFLTEWAAEANKPDFEKILEEQKIGSVLTDRVVSKLDGDKFKKATLDKAPEYYLLYFSASW